MAPRLSDFQPADAAAALANWSTNGCASPDPPGEPGAQKTRVAIAANMSVLMATGYHYPMMSDHRTMFVSPRLLKLFLRLLQARHVIVGIFVLLTLAGIYGALRIPTDTSIDRLIVASDPVAQATREFERVYPQGEEALIVLEAPNPLSPAVLQSADQLERELDKIPKVAAHSLLTVYFRSSPPASIGLTEAAQMC